MGRMASEFYTLTVQTTGSMPLDLGGAAQVLFQCGADSPVYVSNMRDSFDDAFILQPSVGAAAPLGPMVVNTNDERLYLRSILGPVKVYVWVIREQSNGCDGYE